MQLLFEQRACRWAAQFTALCHHIAWQISLSLHFCLFSCCCRCFCSCFFDASAVAVPVASVVFVVVDAGTGAAVAVTFVLFLGLGTFLSASRARWLLLLTVSLGEFVALCMSFSLLWLIHYHSLVASLLIACICHLSNFASLARSSAGGHGTEPLLKEWLPHFSLSIM